MGEQRYSTTYSEFGIKLHVSVALIQATKSFLIREQEIVWAAEPMWTLFRRQKPLPGLKLLFLG